MKAHVCVLLVAFGCSGAREPVATRAPAKAPAKTKPAAEPVAPTAPPKLATCTDGGALTNAFVSSAGARFCLDGGKKRGITCWHYAKGEVAPADPATAAKQRSGETEIAREDPEPPHSAWEVKIDNDTTLTICHSGECKPLAVGGKPGDDRTAIADAKVSPSGSRVAVMRGTESLAKSTLEIWDRDSGKKLGQVRGKMLCAKLLGFATDVAAMVEWDCANQGGPLHLVAPTGKLLLSLDDVWTFNTHAQPVGDGRWAFVRPGDRAEIIDLARGKRLATLDLDDGAIGFVGERAYVINSNGYVQLLGLDGKPGGGARPPSCRYEWETESIGGLTVNMSLDAVNQWVGEPKSKTKPDPKNLYHSTWSYPNGLVLEIEAANVDPNTNKPMLPYRVAAITLTAPSKLTTGKGIGIGSAQAAVEAAYGAHRVEKLSTATKLVAGNDDETEGLEFELADGKVTKIHL
jgi:hypothetical protein